jgi:hypothetical protein
MLCLFGFFVNIAIENVRISRSRRRIWNKERKRKDLVKSKRR